MKKLSTKLILALFAISAGLCAQATTWTVNNATAPVNPGQYSMISGAIAAASAGDTIIVAGSATAYDEPINPSDVAVTTIVLDKPLVLIGPGYNPKGANRYPAKILQPFQINSTASGSTIIGLWFDNYISPIMSGGTHHSNITFERNYFNYNTTIATNIINFSVDTAVNIQFVNNIFNGDQIQFTICYNSAFYNNIFLSGESAGSSSFSGIYDIGGDGATPIITIDHNLFLYGSYSTPLLTSGSIFTGGLHLNFTGLWINNALVTNNIFYNCFPLDFQGWHFEPLDISSSYLSNNSYYNNITYAGEPIPDLLTTFLGGIYLTNFAAHNINNTNPMMNAIFSSPTYPYLDFNLDNVGLQPGSPCDSAGTDGTNIGPTGGLYPIYNTNATYLTGEPAIPEVTQLSITGPTTVPIGTPVTIQVKAAKLN